MQASQDKCHFISSVGITTILKLTDCSVENSSSENIYVQMDVCLCGHIYIYVYICLCMCMYAYIYIIYKYIYINI